MEHGSITLGRFYIYKCGGSHNTGLDPLATESMYGTYGGYEVMPGGLTAQAGLQWGASCPVQYVCPLQPDCDNNERSIFDQYGS